MKLFENQRKSSDEFTKWCEEFLSKFQTPLDGKFLLCQLFCPLILKLFSSSFQLQSQHLYHFSRHVNLLSMSTIMSDLIWERIRSQEILQNNFWKRDLFTGINRGNRIRLVLKWCPGNTHCLTTFVFFLFSRNRLFGVRPLPSLLPLTSCLVNRQTLETPLGLLLQLPLSTLRMTKKSPVKVKEKERRRKENDWLIILSWASRSKLIQIELSLERFIIWKIEQKEDNNYTSEFVSQTMTTTLFVKTLAMKSLPLDKTLWMPDKI